MLMYGFNMPKSGINQSITSIVDIEKFQKNLNKNQIVTTNLVKKEIV